MREIVKPLLLTVISLSITVITFSQLRLSANDAFVADLKKVIVEYPNQFAKIIGPVIMESVQSTDYECTVKISGVESSSITRYSANNKSIYSWQATLLKTESFAEAAKRFRSLFTAFNGMSVMTDYGLGFSLKGSYEAPDEEKKFTDIIFRFGNADHIMNKMRLEIALQYELMEWEVRVLIYDRDREDDERGDAHE